MRTLALTAGTKEMRPAKQGRDDQRKGVGENAMRNHAVNGVRFITAHLLSEANKQTINTAQY